MTARQVMVDALAPLVADVDVIAYARDIVPARRTAMVRVDTVTPGVAQMTRTYAATLLLLTPHVDPSGPADDDLDDLLEDVLYALDNPVTPGGDQLAIVWERAERATYSDTTPAYAVTITVHLVHTRT